MTKSNSRSIIFNSFYLVSTGLGKLKQDLSDLVDFYFLFVSGNEHEIQENLNGVMTFYKSWVVSL